MADATDLKSVTSGYTGSSPVPGTTFTLKFHVFAPYLPHTSCKSLFCVLSYVVTCQKEWSRHEKRKYMEKSKENE